MENNTAIVAILKNIQKIEGADRIVCAEVHMNGIKQTQVVVGIDTQENTKIVYFDSNLALSDQLIKDYPELATYLAKGNRVRTIKLKGIISNGLAVELSKFYKYDKTDALKFCEGYSFTSLGTTEICKKWAPPVKVAVTSTKKGRKGKVISRIIPGQFNFHIDTEQLLRNIHKIKPDSIISISRKIHGTSAIVSHALVKRPLNIVEKFLQRIGIKINDTMYDYLYSSRTVVKNGAQSTGFYFVDIWSKAGEDNFKGKLHQGESVYYEIVGYLPNTQSFIQKNYAYGCKPGEYKIAVYRITKTGLDGNVVEYSWQAMKQRCQELNVPMVEEYYFGLANNKWVIDQNFTEEIWRQEFIRALQHQYLEKSCFDCFDVKGKAIPDEGIVIRVEGLGIEVYKLKSEAFLLRENQMKDEEVIDIEEEQK